MIRALEGAVLSVTNSTLEFSKTQGIYSEAVDPVILNNTISGCNSYGIYIDNAASSSQSNPEIRNNVINNCSYPIYLSSDNTGGMTGSRMITENSGTGNSYQRIRLGGYFTGTTVLSADNGFPWSFSGQTFVTSSASLSLDPGAIVQIGSYFYVSGSLLAEGTPSAPIIFTSIYDIEGGTPAPGNWGFIRIYGGASATFDYAQIRYGGSNSTSPGMIRALEGAVLSVTNSTLEFSESQGIYVETAYHYISGNRFNAIASYAVYNGNTSEIQVKAENNWWGASNGPDPYGDGYGINYRCYDYETGTYYICEYYVDAVPWIGMDYSSSQDLIDEELPPEPNRNTAEMEPGVPYIEYVKSQHSFFYFGGEISDRIEIRVDWNGSEPGRGTPGTIKISIDGLPGWIDQYLTNSTDENGGYYNFNPSVLGLGFKEISFEAWPYDQSPLVKSDTFTQRATRLNAPAWLLDIGFKDAPLSIVEKPDYTEVKFSGKIPPELKSIEFCQMGSPIVDKINPVQMQVAAEVFMRSNGQGGYSINQKVAFGGEDSTFHKTSGFVGGMDTFSVQAYVFFDGTAIFQLPWYGETMGMDGTFSIGAGGEVSYEESLLILIPGVGPAISHLPGIGKVTHMVYVEGKVEPEISLSAEVSVDQASEKLKWSDLSFESDVKITLTTGIKIWKDVLEANIYGGGEIEQEYCLAPSITWKKSSGALFAGAELIVLDIFKANPEARWEIEKSNPDVVCNSRSLENNLSQIGGESGIKLIGDTPAEWSINHPDYTQYPYADFKASIVPSRSITELDDRSISNTLIVSNLYKSAAPAITVNGSDAVMLWVHDDLALDDTQSKELMASTWNGVTWSEPVQVTDNIFVDFAPQLAFLDDTHVMAIWQQIKDSTIPDDATLTPEIGQAVELVYAIYDLTTNTWSAPTYLTNNTALDHRANLMVAQDGTLMVTWVQNTVGQLIGDSYAYDQIKFATWNGSSWDVDDVTNSNISSLVSYDAALHTASQGVMVFSKGKYGDLTDMNELELFYTEWDGTTWSAPATLTSNNIVDESPSVNYTSLGEKRLIWLQENELMMLGDDWSLAPTPTQIARDGYLLRNFETAVDNEDNIALIWSGVADEGSDLFYSLYDAQSQTWLLAEQLTDSLAVEKQLSPSFDGSGQLMIAYALDNVAPETIERDGVFYNNVMTYQSTDLHVLHYTPDSDLTVSDLSLPYRPNPEPGETVLVRANIVNSGDWSVENPSISFYDGDPALDGTLIGTYGYLGYLAAGTSITAEVNWTVPADSTTSHTLFAVVDPDGLIDERDETNNQASLITILPDLTVSSVSSYYYDQYTVVPLAVIYNNGKLNVENVMVEFRDGAVDGPVVYSEVVPLIEKEGMVAVSTEMDVSSWASGTYEYFVTIDTGDEILEVDEENNSDYFTIAVLPDLVIYAGDITTTLEEGIGGSADVTLRNWGTTAGTNITVSLYEGPDIDLGKAPLHTWTVPSLAVDNITTLSTTIDHIPHHLFAVADPDNLIKEIDESNNVAFEDLPVVNGSYVIIVGSSDPNLADIIYSPSEFDEETGAFSQAVEANLYDVSTITASPQLCDISTLTDFTDLQGKIALIEKTDLCTYDVQVNNAGNLGAVGVLIFNDSTGGNLRETMTGLPVTIPAGFLPRQDGLDLLPYHGQTIRITPDSEAVTILDPYR